MTSFEERIRAANVAYVIVKTIADDSPERPKFAQCCEATLKVAAFLVDDDDDGEDIVVFDDPISPERIRKMVEA